MNTQIKKLKELKAKKKELDARLRYLRSTRHLRPDPYAFIYEIAAEVFAGKHDKENMPN
jgi:hypothetical protein